MPTTERILEVRAGLRACVRCPLRSEASQVVVPRGPGDAELVVVGEAPGKTEDIDGKPFVGAAGHLLAGAMREAGIEPNGVVYTNSALCYPKKSNTPNRSHLDSCSTNLRAVLSAWAPSIIIAAGQTALSAFWWDLKGDLSKLHGRPLFYSQERLPADIPKTCSFCERDGRPCSCNRFTSTVWPTYHPASALSSRNPQYRSIIVNDLTNLTRYHRYGQNEWPSDCWVCGGELYDWDPRGLARCETHSQLQGTLPLSLTTG